jgi:hypothetical protein
VTTEVSHKRMQVLSTLAYVLADFAQSWPQQQQVMLMANSYETEMPYPQANQPIVSMTRMVSYIVLKLTWMLDNSMLYYD